MKIFVKICGVTRLEDAKFAVECGADAVGFVAYPKSPRFIPPSSAGNICAALNCRIRKIGVFVNDSQENIKKYIDAGIDTVQLHGNETEKFAEKIAESAEIEVWKAIKPKDKSEIAEFKNYPADKFLIDAFSESLHGGTGQKADWEAAKFAVENLQKPVILAGGLSPDNVQDAVKIAYLFGIDVNSGVEISPGIKDHKLIKKLFSMINP